MKMRKIISIVMMLIIVVVSLPVTSASAKGGRTIPSGVSAQEYEKALKEVNNAKHSRVKRQYRTKNPVESTAKEETTTTPTPANVGENVDIKEERVVTKTPGKENGFIHTKGSLLVDERGQEYVIHGMNFGNKVWYNPSTPQTYYNDENSYKELSEMGINTIRYYLNFALLEECNGLGGYKETGFNWLDKNVEWASKYGIKIIFNMHIPQGAMLKADSYDQHCGSLYLFYTNSADGYKKRLNKMWQYIANRYKDNPAVLGYSLLNEPVVPFTKNLETSVKIWEDYAQELTDIIRSVDKNHIIFVEPTTNVYNTTTHEYSVYDYSERLFVPKDDNVVSEYHFYYPTEFTHQAYNSCYKVGSAVYPNTESIAVSGKRWKDCIFYYKGYENSTKGYEYVESPLKTVTNLEDYNVAYTAFRAIGKEKGWSAYFDNACIKVYDENKQYVETIMPYDFNTSVDYRILEGYYGGCAKYCEKGGIDNSGCLMLKDSVGEFSISSASTYKYFKLKKGYSYKACAYVKVVNPTKTAVNVTPTISFESAEEVYSIDKDYLEEKVDMFTEFLEETNHTVPIYMGEFGTFEETYDYGGYTWMSDMLDILTKKGLNFSYHEYRPGLYTGYDDVKNTQRNDTVYNIFKSKLVK